MRLKSLEVDNDGDKGLTIFDEPRDVKLHGLPKPFSHH